MEGIKKIWPKWEPVEVLGKGGFGTVYKCKRENFGEVLWSAIKVVKIPSDDAQAKEMTSTGFTEEQIRAYYQKSVKTLVDEIRMMETMKSASHIVGIEDFEVVEDGIGWKVYIRMELLTNLQDYLMEKGVSVEEIVKMAMHILSALEHCHEMNIIHRDIKPANIFVSRFGEYKLGDFGISRQVERNNATMSQKGTKSYMAPEMIRLSKYGKNVDLYALGLTMYELLNHGRMPFLPPYPELFFPDDREEAMLKRLSGEVFPMIKEIGKLNDIILKACHYDPNMRYQNATDMKEDLMYLNEEKKTTPPMNIITSDENTVYIFTSEEKTTNIFDSEEKTVNIFDSEEKTINVFDSEDKTMNVFNQNEFIFEDSVVMEKTEKVYVIEKDKYDNYYLVFTNGYFEYRHHEFYLTSQDSKTLHLKSLFEKYLTDKNKVEILEEMLAIDPCAKLYGLLADEYAKAGESLKAIELYQKSYALDSEDAYILKRMAMLKYYDGDYNEALDLILKASENYRLNKSSANPYIHYSLDFIKALLYQKLGNDIEAAKVMGEFYKIFPSYASKMMEYNLNVDYQKFDVRKFENNLLFNDQTLMYLNQVRVACMYYKIGYGLFDSCMNNRVQSLRTYWKVDEAKIQKAKIKANIVYDDIYFTYKLLFSSKTYLFGKLGIYIDDGKQVRFKDYYYLPQLDISTDASNNIKLQDKAGKCIVLPSGNLNANLTRFLVEIKSAMRVDVKEDNNVSIEHLNLPVSIYNKLQRAGILTIEQLKNTSEQELISIVGIAAYNQLYLKIKQK